MAGPQKLDIYQYALRHLGDARLALITDDVESRYALDDAWPRAVNFVIGQAPWRFALLTAQLANGASTVGGYVNGAALPGDWLRTHAIFLAAGGRELPFDLKDTGTAIAYNVATPPLIRYVSSSFTDPSITVWPEHFAQCLGAYLAFLVAERVTGDRAAPGKMSQLFSQLLPEATAIDADTENPWLPHQRDGSFLRVARTMIDQGYWRFALTTAQMNTSVGGMGGLARQVAIPADWSRSRSLFVLSSDGQRRPLKIREQAGLWYTNATSFYAEYVSQTLAMDSTKWPDHYMRAVLRELEYDKMSLKDSASLPPTYGRDAPQRADTAYKEALADTLDSEALDDDPWLSYQLDGAFDRAAQAVIMRGYWMFALKTADFAPDQQDVALADTGFPYRFAYPADWLKSHALYVSWGGTETPIDIRETATHWSTDTGSFTARYMTTAALDATLWPELVAHAVLTYCRWHAEPIPVPGKGTDQPAAQPAAAVFQAAFAAALDDFSLPEDPWLRFQLDGRYRQGVNMALETGRWRFAVKTVTLTDPNNKTMAIFDPNVIPPTAPLPGDPNAFSDGSVSPGYACRMPRPNDWMRTLRVYYSYMDGLRPVWVDCDYRDETGAIHVNYNPVQMRYVSRLGLDATQWPSHFRDAVLAWLEHAEARADPKLAAVAAKKFELYQAQLKEAETLDDERDVPRVQNTGRFVAARYGRGSVYRAQDWRPW